jgi:predicted amidohydrolase
MATALTIALIQATYPGSTEAALERARDLCREARRRGADLALFPEMWTIGYSFFDPAEVDGYQGWLAQALHEEEEPLASFRALAGELRMAIALTYLRRTESNPENSCVLIDRNGRQVLQYSKVHTCVFEAERFCRAGSDFPVAKLDIGDGDTVGVGIMICYDREFPESARILALNGAELVLVPNACEMERHRTAQLMTRAFENVIAVAMANWPEPKCNGHSMAIGAAFFDHSGRTIDPVIAEAGESDEILLCRLDFEPMRKYRRATIWGTTFRRAEAYGRLSAADPLDPAKLADVTINGNTRIATTAGAIRRTASSGR